MSLSATPATQSAAPKTSPSAPPSAISATPATQNEGGCEIVPGLPRKTHVDVTKCHACHAKCHVCEVIEAEAEEARDTESKTRTRTQSCGGKHLTFGLLLEVEMSKKCTLLCRTHHARSKHFWNVEKVNAVVARSTSKHISKSNCTKHTMLGASTFGSWHVEKSSCCYGAKHISKSTCVKHTMLGPQLGYFLGSLGPFETRIWFLGCKGWGGICKISWPHRSSPINYHLVSRGISSIDHLLDLWILYDNIPGNFKIHEFLHRKQKCLKKCAENTS